jgi:hypothetical protein
MDVIHKFFEEEKEENKKTDIDTQFFCGHIQ